MLLQWSNHHCVNVIVAAPPPSGPSGPSLTLLEFKWTDDLDGTMDVAVEAAADEDGWKQQQPVGEQCDGGMRRLSAGGLVVKDALLSPRGSSRLFS